MPHRSAFGEIMSQIGVKEPQVRAGQAFTHFGEAHRELEKFAIDTLKQLRPVCFLNVLIAFDHRQYPLINVQPSGLT